MFLTGYIPEGLDTRFREELIVPKPFDFVIIKEALRKLIGQRVSAGDLR
jgi:hypothetical protein